MTARFIGLSTQLERPARPDTSTAVDPDVPRFALVASVEPSVVFSSLAARCVPQVCDACTIDIIDGPYARYRIAHPPETTANGGLLRIADQAVAAPSQRFQVSFAHPQSAAATGPSGQATDPHGFHGRATFVWHHRAPTRADHTIAALMIDHAVQTVAWQRSERTADAATDAADANSAHLQAASQTARHIGVAVGILMSLHKITESEAFELLRRSSQHCKRDLSELALVVIDTRWFDPALLTKPFPCAQHSVRPDNKHDDWRADDAFGTRARRD